MCVHTALHFNPWNDGCANIITLWSMKWWVCTQQYTLIHEMMGVHTALHFDPWNDGCAHSITLWSMKWWVCTQHYTLIHEMMGVHTALHFDPWNDGCAHSITLWSMKWWVCTQHYTLIHEMMGVQTSLHFDPWNGVCVQTSLHFDPWNGVCTHSITLQSMKWWVSTQHYTLFHEMNKMLTDRSFLAYPTRFSAIFMHPGYFYLIRGVVKDDLVHDVRTSVLIFWHHFWRHFAPNISMSTS